MFAPGEASGIAAADEAGMAIAAHLLDLAAIGLGARNDVAAAAHRRGLRAVRLKAVLSILQGRFHEPDFSAHKLAAAGLSERYVNELLFEAGASFTTRLTELRLRKAADLLIQRESRISDIAFACGFLFQPLLSPAVRPDADRGTGDVRASPPYEASTRGGGYRRASADNGRCRSSSGSSR